MNRNAKFVKRFRFDIFSERNDKWIGVFTKSRDLQQSNCPYKSTEYFVCIIPCIVLHFTLNRFTQHKKGCYHSKNQKVVYE